MRLQVQPTGNKRDLAGNNQENSHKTDIFCHLRELFSGGTDMKMEG
jgi:hypothetical protein